MHAQNVPLQIFATNVSIIPTTLEMDFATHVMNRLKVVWSVTAIQNVQDALPHISISGLIKDVWAVAT